MNNTLRHIALIIALAISPLFLTACNMDATKEINSTGNYVPNIEDIPLPNGFIGDYDNAISYDTPQGRIIESEAVGKSNANSIQNFYINSLPHLGWKKSSSQYHDGIKIIFTRQDERLQIHIQQKQPDTLSLHFSLSPI